MTNLIVLSLQEPHPADDLNGADVARKLTILSRYIPSLAQSLPLGYHSVATTSLIPKELEGIPTGDEFLQKLPQFDETFEKMRNDAKAEGSVLRFVGVIDVKEGVIKAALEKCDSISFLPIPSVVLIYLQISRHTSVCDLTRWFRQYHHVPY